MASRLGSEIEPGALAKGLGQSLKVISTIRVNVEQRTSISKNRSYNATTSKLNKLAENSFHVHPCFDEKEGNSPFCQGAEMNQYTLTSGARARGQSLGINVEKLTLIDKNRSPFESRKAKKVFEVAQGAKETETSLFEFDKAKKLDLQVCLNLEKKKKVVEVVQDAEGIETNMYFLIVSALLLVKQLKHYLASLP
ncbi:hypothetical protein H5410_002444 [Solanum commersonii]|uniref:Uncharacterized protein n=1 Tax=Solanum commersonii TaxID=4109 RepID=A0A9J6B2V0_SOLCO|nr:hypothetical protein H5410_002444 [Solanum commersonii]